MIAACKAKSKARRKQKHATAPTTSKVTHFGLSANRVHCQMQRARIHSFTSPNGTVCTNPPGRNLPLGFPTIISWTFILIGPGFFLTTPTLHPLLVATLRFDHGRQCPTAEGEGRRSLIAECSYRWAESREGGLKHRTGQGCFRLRRYISFSP